MKILTPNLSAFVNAMISALVSVLLTVSLYWVAPSPVHADTTLSALEDQMNSLIQAEGQSKKMTLILESESGVRFIASVLEEPDDFLYLPDSTTKWITSLVILDQVAKGNLSLDTKAADLLAERADWPQTGNLSQITLRHLLAQTSGLVDNPSCSYLPFYSMEGCVKQIARIHEKYSDDPDYAPGNGFFYAYAHFQVAGLMAIEAAQRTEPDREMDWDRLFRDFKAGTGLMPRAFYIIPNPWNPMLSGGMSWKALDYHEAIRAMYHRQVLTPDLINAMLAPQTLDSVPDPAQEFAFNPMSEQGYDLGVMQYGLGNWVEGDTDEDGVWQSWGRNSSGGLFGSYPFMSEQDGYFGVLAKQSTPRTFDEAYAFFEQLEPLIRQWAELANQSQPQ